MRTALRYTVRAMTLADIPQVIEIERESFPAMWPQTAFKRELQTNRLARYIVVVEHKSPDLTIPAADATPPAPSRRLFGGILGFFAREEEPPLPPVEEREHLIAAFIGLWMLPDEAHIVTIATRETHRRRGLGELLLIRAIELAQASGHAMVTLECRVSNEAALALYAKYGFEQVGLRPRYYSDNHEDATVMTVSSALTPEYREAFARLRSAHLRRWGDYGAASPSSR